MVHVLQRLLILGVLLAPCAQPRKFYADDPLQNDPKPLAVGKLATDKLSDSSDFVHNTLKPGSRQKKGHELASLDVNTLDELPDSAWYTNRHNLTMEQLTHGIDGSKPPSMEKPWTVYQAKLEGVTPGFRIKDATGERYVIKFDPMDNIEMATGADVIGSKFFYAFGYNVPDNYPVRFRREQLQLGEKVTADLDHLLSKVPHYPDGSYRALASRFISGDILGPFEFSGTRRDDPNDTIAHERRRVLRGLFVFCAWLDHTDSRAINTLDTIQQIDGVRAVRHYLIDFGATLGSDSLIPKEAWHGHTYTMDFKSGLLEMGTLGLYAPDWERTRYHFLPSVGKYEAATFRPDDWKPSYANPAFDQRTVEDCFWAAKKVMSFTDAQIRAMVATAQFSNPQAVEDIARVMIERRDKIGKYYFSQVLPLDRFEVAGGNLIYKDLGGSEHYSIAWSKFDNNTGSKTPISGEATFRVPQFPGYLAADLSDGTHHATVYTRDGRVVGVDR